MNTLNFDTLTSGDILLTTTRSGVEGYYFFGEDKNLWSVKAVENGDNPTATVVPLGLPSSDEYILTLTDGQPVLTATMGEEKIITPICISQYTPEEAANISLRRRLSAENELSKFITYSTYKDMSTFSVHGDIEKAYLTNYPYPHPSTHLNNIADARARMDAVKGAAVDAYQRINESDLSTIDKMLTLTREAVAAVHKHISEANIDYTPRQEAQHYQERQCLHLQLHHPYRHLPGGCHRAGSRRAVPHHPNHQGSRLGHLIQHWRRSRLPHFHQE